MHPLWSKEEDSGVRGRWLGGIQDAEGIPSRLQAEYHHEHGYNYTSPTLVSNPKKSNSSCLRSALRAPRWVGPAGWRGEGCIVGGLWEKGRRTSRATSACLRCKGPLDWTTRALTAQGGRTNPNRSICDDRSRIENLQSGLLDFHGGSQKMCTVLL